MFRFLRASNKALTATMKNVHYSVRPFYIVSKALGAFTYSYHGPYCNGVLKFSIPGIVWFGVLVGIFVSMFTISAIVQENVTSTSTILSEAWDISLSISFATMLASKFHQMSKQTSILRFLKTIDEIDAKVGGEKLT